MGHSPVWRRIPRLGLGFAIVASLALVPATPAFAADTLDQSFAASGMVTFVHDVMVAGQSFTAGATGSLNRVDLSIGRLDNPGPLTISIETAPGGIPSGTVLATAAVAPSAVANDGAVHAVTIALPASLSTAGTQYAIVAAAPGAAQDTAWIWEVDSTNGYAGGTSLEGDTSKGTWTVHATDDRTFATYVDPTPCAPGTWSSTGYGPCAPADAGSFAAGPGATAQTPCAIGSYQPEAGSVSCLAAPVGTYVDTAGAIATIACPAGTTTAGTGSTSADACQPVTTTPLTITCQATPDVLWPPNGKFVPITVNVATTGATGFSLASVVANEGKASDMRGWTVGTADTSGQVRASRSGQGARVYVLTYQATDGAGGMASCQATVTVPHDRGHDGPGAGGDV
jgi:Tyrosine-protein kinase ephrin type A/B receptor-like